MKNFVAALVAGLLMFIWGFVAWVVLPMHKVDVYQFADENAVIEVMQANSSQSGMYFIPGDEADLAMGKPSASVNLLKTGHHAGQGQMMLQGVIGSVIMAYLMIMLLSKTSGLGFVQKVGFVTLGGVLLGLSGSFMYWNWFSYPSGYSLMILIDSIIAWAIAGVAIAKLSDT